MTTKEKSKASELLEDKPQVKMEPEGVKEELPDGLLIQRIYDGNGRLLTNITPLGDVKSEGIITILEVAIKTARESILGE